ncbi:MAG TPA: nuclear transport factor 2 family protein, partial [Thermoanaerobaculia bacterium]
REKKLAEGIERFYADDVEMFESAGESTKGKNANIERERAFESGLTRWDAQLHSSAVDETRGIAYNHWTINFDHAQFGRGVLEQIAVQQWRDGKIVREAFYKLS